MSKYTLNITDNETGKVDIVAREAFFASASHDKNNSTAIIKAFREDD